MFLVSRLICVVCFEMDIGVFWVLVYVGGFVGC